ncbi:copper-binding protein [Aquabacterium sp. A7-Y]|uniref:copper-binding protein n=1 Tax=Aquabacterium sp. A7-Y TaxID=1349605 RepID=UPI00223D0E66|nr:copper-binding protein [Aquabacterium sp. A7-Y]MCW7541428.1 copper-binding protein [Aquabacterium sp. A7-Y]
MTDGEVEQVDKERGEVVLKHGDLPSLGMPPMTMAFNASKQVLERLSVGDKVRFYAEIVKGEPTLTHVEPAGERAPR